MSKQSKLTITLPEFGKARSNSYPEVPPPPFPNAPLSPLGVTPPIIKKPSIIHSFFNIISNAAADLLGQDEWDYP